MIEYIKNHSKYIKFVFIIVLFFFGSLLQLIPISIFKIKTIDSVTNIYLNTFSNVIILLILLYIYRKSLKEDWKNFIKNKSELFDVGFKYWFIGLMAMVGFNILINIFSPNEIANNEESIRNMLTSIPLLMFINTTTLAPFIEELIFRKSFREVIKNNILFILMSGIVFGSLHVVFDIKNAYDYLYLLPYCSLGIAFSYMYYKSKNIMVPILMHIIHNTLTTIMALISLGVIL